MKFAFGLFAFLWLLSGVAGAWVLDDLDSAHWKMIAKGPLTLIKAANDAEAHWPWE